MDELILFCVVGIASAMFVPPLIIQTTVEILDWRRKRQTKSLLKKQEGRWT